jgi:WD40 repeat protein
MRSALACLVFAGLALPSDPAAPAGPLPKVATDRYGDPLSDGAIARLGPARFHHPGGVLATAFAPDGKTLLVANPKGQGLSLRLWDTASGTKRSQFELPGKDLCGLAFTPDGQAIVVGRHDTLTLHDPSSGKLLRTVHVGREICTFALSADGKLLAAQPSTGEDHAPIRIWDTASGKELAPFPGRGTVGERLRFSADGKRLLSLARKDKIDGKASAGAGEPGPRLACSWDVATRKQLHEAIVPHGDVALAPDGETLAFQQPDGLRWIRVLNLTQGKEVCQIPIPARGLMFTPDNKALITLGVDGVRVWDTATGRENHHWRTPVTETAHLGALSSDGKRLALLADSRPDGMIQLFDLAVGHPLLPGGGHAAAVTCLAFEPKGKFLASGSADCTIRLWDCAAGKELRVLSGHERAVLAVAVAPNGKVVASSSADGTTRLWDAADGKELARLDGPGEGGALLCFSGDGKYLTAATEAGEVAVWELGGAPKAQILQAAAGTQLVALDAGGPLVVFAEGTDENGNPLEMLRVRDALTAKRFRDLRLPTPTRKFGYSLDLKAALSHDATMIALGRTTLISGRGAELDLSTLRVVERVTGQELLKVNSTVTRALAFAPNGRLLAADHGGNDGSPSELNLWDTVTGKRLGTLRTNVKPTTCLAFSRDGKLLAAGNANFEILVWDVSRLAPADPEPGAASVEQLQQWWDDLGASAAVARQAQRRLLANPGQAIKYLGARLKPVAAPGPPQLAALIDALDHSRYAERQRATQALEEHAELAEGALRQSLAGKPTLECRRRVELLLEKLERGFLSPAQLRTRRAIAVLEGLGGPEARTVLEALAAGAAESGVTQEARAALLRLPPPAP